MEIQKAKYEVFTVKAAKTGKQFIVVNKVTNQTQSAWKSLLEARRVARDLNLWYGVNVIQYRNTVE